MPQTTGLPEFSLAGKVVLVSGGARGLGLTQAEALLEAGATGILSPNLQYTSNQLTNPPQCMP
jgi:short-subunit dehydrogenase involved in D-alanine esterification of teichoic acids